MAAPTLREIASVCRVNVSTVSRALAGHPSIPPRTCRRIQRKAMSLGWKPNPLVSAYMSHLRGTRDVRHQGNLAFLISFTEIRRFADLPFYHREVFAGAHGRAADLGYSLSPFWLRDVDFDLGRLVQVLRNRGVSGVILHAGKLGPAAFAAVDLSAFALVTWGFTVHDPPLDRVAHHAAHGMRMALSQIRAAGYRRIALVLGSMLAELGDYEGPAAYLFMQQAAGISPLMKIFDSSSPTRKQEIELWLRQRRPDAILGDHVVVETLKDMEWKVPGDVAFASPYWAGEESGIAGIDHLPRLIGANAVDLLSGQIARNERGIPKIPKLVLTEGVWRDGPSLPSRNTLVTAETRLAHV
jgi:DNA-binding LacI/PurR family transcriptional regulator